MATHLDLFDLSDDLFRSICDLLAMGDLRALSSSSRKGFFSTLPVLVRTVKISRSPPQFFDFCEFVQKHDLCSFIVHLTITRSAFHSDSERNAFMAHRPHFDVEQSALFANALVPVLKKAKNIAYLAFNKCIDFLLKCGPRVAEVICRHPPTVSLELWGAEARTLKMFESISGLTHVKLQTFPLHICYGEAEEAADTILRNSCQTLETVAVGDVMPLSLRFDTPPSFSCSNVHHLSVHGPSIQVEKIAAMFPNLKTLACPRPRMVVKFKDSRSIFELDPLVYVDCPPRTLWPTLRSFSGPRRLGLTLSRTHSLQRLNFIDQFPYTEVSQFAELSETLGNSDIRALSVELDLWAGSTRRRVMDDDETKDGYPTLLVPCLSTIVEAANRLRYLCLRIAKSEEEVHSTLKHLIRTAPMLAQMQHLKYLNIGVMAYFHLESFRMPMKKAVSTKPEEIVRAWADSVRSLEYLELEVGFEGWEHAWWRIDACDRTFW
ncbi:hypothetical protein CVT26_004558, partial [Gymnopilus dilepis]